MITREPALARLLQDVCRVVYFSLIILAVVLAVSLWPRLHPLWLDVLARLIAAVTAQLITVTLLRIIVPRPRIGSHRVGRDGQYVRWLVSSTLAEVGDHPALRWPYSFTFLTRVLYLRALGAQLSFRTSFPIGLRVRDPSLLAVEAGAQIEPGVVIENALHATGRVRVDSVTIGGGCLVGACAVLMPGTVLGHDARIGPGAYLGPDVSIGVGAKIGERAVLAAGVDVGSHVRIGAGAVVGEGVSVADRAKIMAGAVIPPNSRIREEEVWQGVPARPLYRDARGRPRAASV